MDTMVGGGKQDTESVPSEDVPLAEIQPEVDVKQQEQEKEEEKQEQAQAQPVNSQVCTYTHTYTGTSHNLLAYMYVCSTYVRT